MNFHDILNFFSILIFDIFLYFRIVRYVIFCSQYFQLQEKKRILLNSSTGSPENPGAAAVKVLAYITSQPLLYDIEALQIIHFLKTVVCSIETIRRYDSF